MSVEATVVLPGGAPAAGTPPAPAAPAAGTPAPAAGTAPTFSIPDSYKDKPYLKGVDSMDKVFGMLDGAQGLLGKRPAGIPDDKATPEDWSRFYDAAGRPKTAAEYQFEIDPKLSVDDKLISKTKELMYKHGLTASQAKGLQKDFDVMGMELAKERGQNIEKQNTDFNALGAKLFGVEREKVMARGKELLDTFTPPELKGEIAKLSNENLLVLAGVLNNIHAKYIKNDSAPNTPPAGGSQGSADSMRAEAQRLMTTDAWNNSMHPQHDATKAKVREMYLAISGAK